MITLLLATSLWQPAQTRSLTVFAAASLKESFTTIARRYEASHPGLTIKLNFAGSQTLAAQINHGAQADVFASAGAKNLDDIAYDKGSLRVFVLNKLEIAVRNGLGGVRSVRDLAKVQNLVVADPSVPVGRYTEAFFSKASKAYGLRWLAAVRSHVVSREVDVKAVLAKVKLGEADAGVVYVSDVATARGQVGEVPIPDDLNLIAEYPVGIPAAAANKEDAKHFIKSLMDDSSQALFARDGFVSVTSPVSTLLVRSSKGTSRIPLPLSSKFPTLTVQVANERKEAVRYTGVPVVAVLSRIAKAGSVDFVGADRYVQTIPIAELKARKAILVRSKDGNYQLIVPGLKPSTWVQWIRTLVLR